MAPPSPLPESHIVSDLKQPTRQIAARASKQQMPEEGEEHLLHDVFSFLPAQPEGGDVPEEWSLVVVEQTEDLPLEVNVRR